MMKQLTYMADKLWEKGAKRALDRDELVDAAVMALIKARRRFDPKRAKWATFAAFRAFGAMKDALRELDHVPRLERARAKRDGRQIRELLSIDRSPYDLVPKDIPDPDALDPLIASQGPDLWRRIREELRPQQAAILEHYFRDDLTLKAIADRIGMSESRCCQIVAAALKRLRRQLPQERNVD